MPKKQILILEDDPFREREFIRQMQMNRFHCSIHADPIEFLKKLLQEPSRICLISLDHDLTRLERSCGTLSQDCGCMVVEFMKSIEPICPVIIHSQNDFAASVMIKQLKETKWYVLDLRNWDDSNGNWIEKAWIKLILWLRETGVID